jgi:hypothetical protein
MISDQRAHCKEPVPDYAVLSPRRRESGHRGHDSAIGCEFYTPTEKTRTRKTKKPSRLLSDGLITTA